MKNYQCDHCGKSTSDIKTEMGNEFPAGWLSINGKILLHNELENRAISYHGTLAGLHFCSRDCIENYLFKTKTE